MTISQLLTYFRSAPPPIEPQWPGFERMEPFLQPMPKIPFLPDPDPQTWVKRSDVADAIDRAIKAAETSPIWTNNERRSARCIALYLQQQLALPITFLP